MREFITYVSYEIEIVSLRRRYQAKGKTRVDSRGKRAERSVPSYDKVLRDFTREHVRKEQPFKSRVQERGSHKRSSAIGLLLKLLQKFSEVLRIVIVHSCGVKPNEAVQ